MTNPCGTCTMCCKILRVDELAKARGQWCAHCTPGVGCHRYDTRPESCRDFECVWLQTQYQRAGEAKMSPDLRPDRCHVVIDVRSDASGLVLDVDRARPEAHRTPAVAALIDTLTSRGEEVIVAIGEKRKIIRSTRAA